MLTHSSMKYRPDAWPRSCGRARWRMGAFGALSTGLGLSIACGGNADPSAARQGSTSQTCARFAECLDRVELQAECEQDLASKRTSATEAGCTAFYDEFLSCDEQHPGTCDPSISYQTRAGVRSRC